MNEYMVSSEKAWSKLTSSRKSRTEPTVDKKHTFWFNKREKIHNILLTNKKKQAIRTKQCSRVVELKFKAFTKIISPVRHLMTWKCGIVRPVEKNNVLELSKIGDCIRLLGKIVEKSGHCKKIN